MTGDYMTELVKERDALRTERDKALDELQLRKYKYVELASTYDEILAERDLLRQQLDEALIALKEASIILHESRGLSHAVKIVDEVIAKLGEKK